MIVGNNQAWACYKKQAHVHTHTCTKAHTKTILTWLDTATNDKIKKGNDPEGHTSLRVYSALS